MNEELKIIIRAITNDAKKNLEGVRKELENIEKTAQGSNSVGKTMAAVGKGAMAAVAGVVALTSAMVALGKSSLEFQRAQARLNASFQSVGLSSQQAAETYKQLYSYLGDIGRSTETANLLAQLTQEESELAEWTEILMGVYAKFPDSLPVESLAEAINHTAHLGEVQGTLADALEWVGISVESFNAALANTNSVAEREALIRQTLNNLYMGAAKSYSQANQSLLAYNQSQVAVDQALANATAYVIPLMTALNQLSATLLSVLAPAFETISAVVVAFVQWIIAAIKAVGSFFGMFSGKGAKSTKSVSTSMGAIANSSGKIAAGINKVGGAFDGAAKSAEKLKRQTMGFDEMNIMSSQPEASGGGAGGGGGGGAIEIPEVSVPTLGFGEIDVPGLSDFEQKVAKIKEYLNGIAILIGAIGAGLLLWEIARIIKDFKILNMTVEELAALTGSRRGAFRAMRDAENHIGALKSYLKEIGGIALIVVGAMVAIAGYSDAIANGASWGNLAATLGGLAAIIGGLYIAFGALAASIGLVVGGVALLVLGVVDFIKNGPTLQNTILIIGGAIAVAVGLATAGISVLLSAIIAVVAAVAAFTIAILLEEPAIKSVEEAQEELTAAKERATAAENGYINAVDAAEAALDRLTAAEEAAGMTGEELYEQVQSGTLDYANMTDAQKELYKAYIDNEQKQKDLKASTEEFNAAKKAETMASFEHQLALAKESGSYDDFKKSVIDAYKSGKISADEAREMIEKSMSEMSDASQQTFMKDLPSDITNGLDPHRYESTGTKIKKWFGNLWTGIKNVFADVKTWFADIGTAIGTALSNAASSAINWVLQKAIGIINGFIGSINLAIGIINKIPGVSVGYLSKLNVPKLATGGITTGATVAMIGERGKEAVLPLENNTGWMDTLADRIASRSSSPSRIILQVGEKELGWAAINSINDITKQTGGLQLHIV